MKLVIAEKPMLARDIARAMCGVEVTDSTRLPITGSGYTVIACAGHLLELAEPDEIDPAWGKPWSLDVLPICVDDWPQRVARTVDRKTGEVRSKQRLVDEIAALLPDAEYVVHAGDPDDEGQLIVDEVLDYLEYSGKVLRVFVNDSVDKNIRRAFEQAVPNEGCRPRGRAALARSIADKCFGVNESRLASVRLHSNFSVGRVQTPTLGLVVARDAAIEGHVKQKYYTLEAIGSVEGTGDGLAFRFKPSESVLAGEKHLLAPDVPERLKAALTGRTVDVETATESKQESAPLPYEMNTLAADMSRRHKMTAMCTMQATQSLRDRHRAITYNRTDCPYLKDEHFAEAPAVLGIAMENIGASWQLDFTIQSKAFDSSKVPDHHGIIPQENAVDVSNLSEDERRVYEAVVERYAMQFLPPAVWRVSTSMFEVEEGAFTHTCRQLESPGWKGTFGSAVEQDADDSTEGWIEAGRHALSIAECRVGERETRPPAPYTEGTLITDMASIAKYVTDPEVKAVLKKKDEGKRGEHGGIGTTATRASIIEKLKARGFIEERGGKLRSTEKGRTFYGLLPDEIKSADTTARWWLMQEEIAEGEGDVNAIQRSVVEVFERHRETAYVGASVAGMGGTAVGKCPLCGQDVMARKSKKTDKLYYTCSSNRSEQQEDGTYRQVAGCGFKLLGWCGKTFTAKQAAALLEGKMVDLKGCKSKATGKTFDCKLKLKKDGTFEPIFDSGKAKRK